MQVTALLPAMALKQATTIFGTFGLERLTCHTTRRDATLPDC